MDCVISVDLVCWITAPQIDVAPVSGCRHRVVAGNVHTETAVTEAHHEAVDTGFGQMESVAVVAQHSAVAAVEGSHPSADVEQTGGATVQSEAVDCFVQEAAVAVLVGAFLVQMKIAVAVVQQGPAAGVQVQADAACIETEDVLMVACAVVKAVEDFVH